MYSYEQWQQDRMKLILENFKGYREGLVVGLDTTLWQSDGDEQVFLLPAVNDVPLIWSNPVQINEHEIQIQQMYIPYNDDSLTAIKTARRMLSLLCYASHGLPIIEKAIHGGPNPGIPVAVDRFRYPSLNGYDIKLLLSAVDLNGLSEQNWITLAYYRLGSNADSEYYKFLSYLQVIEVSFMNIGKDIDSWLDTQTGLDEAVEWLKTISSGKKISSRLRGETRALCTHVANNDTGSPDVITDPDDIESVRQVQNDLGIIERLAIERLRSIKAIERL
jgi:hypothetical protein